MTLEAVPVRTRVPLVLNTRSATRDASAWGSRSAAFSCPHHADLLGDDRLFLLELLVVCSVGKGTATVRKSRASATLWTWPPPAPWTPTAVVVEIFQVLEELFLVVHKDVRHSLGLIRVGHKDLVI